MKRTHVSGKMGKESKPLLEIKGLKVWYKTYRGKAKVVNGINIYVNPGEKIGLVGESGCGKTTTMKAVLRTLNSSQIKIPQGQILLNGSDILKMNKKGLMEVRRKHISMISQEPMAALNPVFTIGQQLKDIIRHSDYYPKLSPAEMNGIMAKAIENVMLPDATRILNSYPHQLSGGMRQRVCIAMALVTPRDLVIADEPGTALDVTIEDQIHRLLSTLVREKNTSLIMITHSLGVARELVDRIYIMYAGDIVEVAKTQHLLTNPFHPYTIGLMRCVPRLSGGGISSGIYGYVPDYVNPPKGCRFSARCPDATRVCTKTKPAMSEVGKGHYVACFKYTV